MSQRAGEADDPGLGRHHMGAIGSACVRAEAADVDDGAGARLPQCRQAGLDAMEGAIERDVEDFAPGRIVHLGEGLFAPQRGIVDEDVDAAELSYRRIGHGLHRPCVGDVTDMHDRLATG